MGFLFKNAAKMLCTGMLFRCISAKYHTARLIRLPGVPSQALSVTQCLYNLRTPTLSTKIEGWYVVSYV